MGNIHLTATETQEGLIRPANSFDCTCPYGSFPGNYSMDDEYAAPDTSSAPVCLEDCRTAFLSKTFGRDNISTEVCRTLATVSADIFSPLYYLDMQFCGVWSAQGKTGQDPNVDHIINTCQNMGNFNISDPGPPPPDYPCTMCASDASRTKQGNGSPDGGLGDPGGINPSATTLSSISISTAAATSTAQSFANSTPTTTNTLQTASEPSPNSLNSRTMVAVTVCSSVAVIAIIFLLIYLLRRQKKRSSPYHPGVGLKYRIGRITNGGSYPTMPPADSPCPLISPSASHGECDRPPLTPPLRLRERNYLPSLLRPMSLSRIDSAFLGRPLLDPHRNDSFPCSPIYSPTSTRLEPRHEPGPSKPSSPYAATAAATTSMPRLGFSSSQQQTLKSPPPVSFTFPAPPPPRSSTDSFTAVSKAANATAPSSLRNEITSSSNNNTAGTSTTLVAPPGSSPTPPPSPIRPPRPHSTALEIPDLVSPLMPTAPAPAPASPRGPPPNRALPPPPPLSPQQYHHSSAAARTSSAPGPGMGAGAIGVAYSTTHGVSLLHSLNQDSRDIAALNEEYSREARESWGSWNGTGGGGPGVMPVKRGSYSGASTVVLAEADLERLAGRY